jgi:hypothetical protein
MTIAIIASALLITASVMLHYQAMTWIRNALSESGLERRSGVLIGMAAMVAAQMMSVMLYAGAYLALEHVFGIGRLAGEMEGTFIDQFYFSLMSYTTLGVGNIYPIGPLRIISGVEALNGFALIGWSTSFAYTLMRNGWDGSS